MLADDLSSKSATDDFHSWWAIHTCHLKLAPPQEKKLRLLACLSPEVAEELHGYISPTASFEEVYQALAFMMKPEELQQVVLELCHTRAQQPGKLSGSSTPVWPNWQRRRSHPMARAHFGGQRAGPGHVVHGEASDHHLRGPRPWPPPAKHADVRPGARSDPERPGCWQNRTHYEASTTGLGVTIAASPWRPQQPSSRGNKARQSSMWESLRQVDTPSPVLPRSFERQSKSETLCDERSQTTGLNIWRPVPRPQALSRIPNVPQSPRAKSKTGVARHFQLQLLHREVASDLEDRHHLAPQESGKTTRMHIFI